MFSILKDTCSGKAMDTMDDATQYHKIDSPSDDTRSTLSVSQFLFLHLVLLL